MSNPVSLPTFAIEPRILPNDNTVVIAVFFSSSLNKKLILQEG